jgi:ABC-type branched-subunit amino acid transport system substrate-binding protein
MRSPSAHRRPALLLTAAIAAASVLVTACASGSASTGGGATAPRGSIKILLTAPLSSSTFSIPETLSGAQAAVASINAAGGVDGKNLDLISCNDQSDPNQSQLCAQEAVSDHVTAVTGFFLFGPQVFDATQAAGIPVIDTQPVVPQSGTSANSFPIDAGGFSEFYGIGKALVGRGDKNVAIIQINLTASQFNAGIAAAGVKAAGGTVIRTVTAQGGAPDYAPYVQQALRGGNVQAIIFAGGTEDSAKVVLAAEQAGFKGDSAHLRDKQLLRAAVRAGAEVRR